MTDPSKLVIDPIAYERAHVAEDAAIRQCLEHVRRYVDALLVSEIPTHRLIGGELSLLLLKETL
ncbi:hypothetical protein AB0H76_15080 [Nocardia sp. NPDC050712]|uniref:hypothetical protein n=1 Tax=Nocardia sp. NPDC050712 TaxID=3155518 RepID=UPI00341174E1